ncbi:MAG: hypothetical protein R2791_04010 [Saprospiraceae bacterium]
MIGVVTNIVTGAFSWPMAFGLAALVALAVWIAPWRRNKAERYEQLDRKNRVVLLKRSPTQQHRPSQKETNTSTSASRPAEQYLRPPVVEMRADMQERDLPPVPILQIFEENGQNCSLSANRAQGKTTLLHQLAWNFALPRSRTT